MKTPVYITTALLEALLDFASRKEPSKITVPLSVSESHTLNGMEAEALDSGTPVFTDLYLPAEQQSTTSVFGVDVSTPPRQTHGLFISHPQGELTVTAEDDLHEIMIVAVPPWKQANTRAFDRQGQRRPLEPIDAVPPTPELDNW